MKLHADINKLLAAVCYVIDFAEQKGIVFSQYDIVKSLFLADRHHLNEWGRPITFDNYVAMNHGPVPSLAYDLLKGNEFALNRLQIEKLPWSRKSASNGVFSYFGADAGTFKRYLSESDIDALNGAATIVEELSFGQIRRLTHDDPAYLDAWRDDGGARAYEMKLALLFEEANEDRAAELEEYSRFVQTG